ncbi:hypothetical protein [Ottowia sp.]|uniref:hypothetical protein n=1 Tax=Ottowia sp. TaxID=1898956 RepID=UPI003A83E208
MTPIQRYRIEQHEGDYASWPKKSRLWADGHLLPHGVPGYVIEAQYDTPLGPLLITSYDCMYEEANDFLLIDHTGRVVAQATLGLMFCSYLLDAHWPVDAHTLALHYHLNDFYTLTVRPGRLFGSGQPGLQLNPCLDWQRDARMVASSQRLQEKLARVRETWGDGTAA